MKKHLLTFGCSTLLVAGSMAQTLKMQPKPAESAGQAPQQHTATNTTRCGTQTPSYQWDAAFNAQVEKYKQDLLTGKASAVNYTIAVIVHVVHDNETKGGATSYNLSQAQINSQIAVLNADYSGTGLNANTYPATAFQGFCSAATNSVSASSIDGSGRVAIANTGITFCLATKDPNGVTLTEPGIDRIDRNTKGWTAPPYAQAYCDATIKPGSIWNPTKYFNVWALNLGGGLLGYATFPAASGLTGIPGSTGTATTDGVVILGSAFGNTGYQSISAYNKGRSCSHETGHWLGLRHIWGDGGAQCAADDYCNDTPPQMGQNNSPPGADYGCPTYPSQAASCTFGGQTNTNGDMFMNFMDYTDDACMYMFTNDQKARMMTAMANATYRSPLPGNAVTLCNVTVVTPVASFTHPSSICATQNAQFTDASTGPPTSWAWSVNPTAGVVITTATSQNPTINFPAAGTYTVSLTATNGQGSNGTSQVVTVSSCTTSSCDTLSNIGNTDTLTSYLSSNGGYFIGTNGYHFTGLGEGYKKTQFPVNITNVKGGIILFYKNGVKGTKGTSTITLSMVNSATGPGTTVLASQTFAINTATATPAVQRVDYAGNPALQFASPIIIPYVAMFTTPGSLAADFYLTLSTPAATTDTIAVLSGRAGHNATNTGWVLYNSSWLDLGTGAGKNYSIGLIPIACPTAGIQDNTYLGHNINLFPNPSNGLFNFAVALNHATNLNFAVVNTLGQTVFTRTENNFTNGVLTYDLSGFAKGVYFVHITDSENNKTVKKIIIE
ncbi:MAG TPA: T9SS type A sorting domain-containing protein [Bacteroidia bacterium]|jgi:PKD repeat protein|nr:T9SS type A sorting domain-containing protein [Bacteroidia bacterium]